MLWLADNGLSVLGFLVALALAVNTVIGRLRGDKRSDKSEARQAKKDDEEITIKAEEANTDKLALTFNSMSRLNELLEKQNDELIRDLKVFKQAYNLLVQRDRIRDERERVLMQIIRSQLNVELPDLPELPPLEEI